MKAKRNSYYKDSYQDSEWLRNWTRKIEDQNRKRYSSEQIETSIGRTQVWGINTDRKDLQTLVVFPGLRTSALFWDLDSGLQNLGIPLRIFLVETNGLPNLSDGHTPDIKSSGYGEWAAEVLELLKIDECFIAGASFGGLVCMKLSLVKPEVIKAAFLLNPACLQPFSTKFKNLYYNLLPVLKPSEKNIEIFLDKLVFCDPNHRLSEASKKRVIEYEYHALTQFKDKAQKPYSMKSELPEVAVKTYLLLGDRDLLFPSNRSMKNAKKNLKDLEDVQVYENVGHGIETYAEAMKYIGNTISSFDDKQTKVT